MTGFQLPVAIRGGQNENAAAELIGRLATPLAVPRQHDFGIDFFCQLLAPVASGLGSDHAFTLQVKPRAQLFTIGGRANGSWKFYEQAWYRSLALPLFLGKIEITTPSLDIYSLAPIWRVLWQTSHPFLIECPTEDAQDDFQTRPDVTFTPAEGVHDGDARVWHAPLGPPFLRLTHQLLADPGWSRLATDILRAHVQADLQNLGRFHLGVSIHDSINGWATNQPIVPSSGAKAAFWDPTPGVNIERIAAAIAPAALALGLHLQSQDDHDAYRLIPLLDWLRSRGILDAMSEGLLAGLLSRQQQGLGPRLS